jgi:hypothetical protein
MNNLDAAIKKHGNAIDAVLNEPFEMWLIGQSMALLAMMAREIAAAEKARRES